MKLADIEKVPKEIGRLEYLQVLDMRDTNILTLPPLLRSLAHLLVGRKSNLVGLTLIERITKLTALQTICGVEICGCSPNASRRRGKQGLRNLKRK